MTTRRIDAGAFTEMGILRPLVEREVKDIHPQAVVDKAIDKTEEPPAEEVGPRCRICFAPMPCEEHANVENLDVVTSLEIPVEKILAKAHERDLEVLVLVGISKDGHEYFAASCPDAAENMYHLQRGIHRLNRIIDDDDDNDA